MIVRAPATSANLGAGFDCAAVALGLWNELEVTDGASDDVEVVIEGIGEDELPRDGSNLTVRAYALLEDPRGKRFSCRNRIPLERGLGSSAAAIALGLAAARPGDEPNSLIGTALSLEGHADNLACALVGGVTLTWDGNVAKIADSLPLDPVAVIPRTRLKTALSRHGLPPDVPHGDAAVSVGRAALLGAAAASGDKALFVAALHDRLHEPYRPSPVLDSVRSDLPPGARGATLSGSGTTVIVWAEDAAACAAALRERFAKCEVRELSVVATGALG
jgi:homoserine kinase